MVLRISTVDDVQDENGSALQYLHGLDEGDVHLVQLGRDEPLHVVDTQGRGVHVQIPVGVGPSITLKAK